MLNPANPIFSLLATLVALVTCRLLTKRATALKTENRFGSIDGLRGYLAFAVFVHHSAIWYFYLQSGKWTVPPSNLYTHFGQTSVAIFFMITGFLFYTKLIESRSTGIDWSKFFIARLLRLMPLYLFSVSLLFLITIYRSNGALNEPVWATAKNLIKWLTFTVFGAPGINGFSDTWVVMAGVTWSLPYEWFFYFALPVMAFTVRSVPPAPFLLASLSSIAFAYTYGLENHHLLAFGGGIFAALVNRSNAIRTIGRSWLAPLVVVACFVSVVALFPTAYGYPQLMLISVAFTLIAAGCSLYGIFTNSVSKALGEMAYSIYLLHGIFLFTVIDLIVGRENVAQMSPLAYWLLIVTMTPLMILGSFATFNRIEKPLMGQAPHLITWLHRRLGKARAVSVLGTAKT